MASNYDEYMKELEDGRKAELTEAEKTYGDMSKDYEEEYDKQIEGLDDFEKKQTEAQNESYDFTIEQIEQQKRDAEKDYQKEQTAAYRDYEKQIDPYGVHAEQIAANGLDKSGYSESSKVAMYKAYQNRITAARESYEKATREFENTMTQAKLQNDVALAEIAYNTYQQRVTLTLQKLQTKNGLLLELINKKASIDSTYNSLYADALEKKANNGENTVLSIDNNNNNSEVIYSNIVEQLKANGVPDEYASGIMTQKEWARRKGSSRASETGSTAVTSFDTYQDYLTFYTEYLIEQYGS